MGLKAAESRDLKVEEDLWGIRGVFPAMISHEAASDGDEWIQAEMMALGAGT